MLLNAAKWYLMAFVFHLRPVDQYARWITLFLKIGVFLKTWQYYDERSRLKALKEQESQIRKNYGGRDLNPELYFPKIALEQKRVVPDIGYNPFSIQLK